MTGFSLWYIKVVYDSTQLSEAEKKKLKYYTFQSFTCVRQSSDTPQKTNV
jgi:hypothetical protein